MLQSPEIDKVVVVIKFNKLFFFFNVDKNELTQDIPTSLGARFHHILMKRTTKPKKKRSILSLCIYLLF